MFFKKVTKIIQKTEFPLFLTAIFLFRIPPFFLTPFAKNPLLSSHSLGRYLLMGLFFGNLLLISQNRKKIVLPKGLKTLVFFFFTTQSLSIVTATNIEVFLLQYKNLVFGLLIFFSATFTINSKKRLSFTTFVLFAIILIHVVF
jgi:hypothetical protein